MSKFCNAPKLKHYIRSVKRRKKGRYSSS